METQGAMVRRIEAAMRRAILVGACGGGHEESCAVRGVEVPCSACLAWLAVEQWRRDVVVSERVAGELMAATS